jgi:hypothetical protein
MTLLIYYTAICLILDAIAVAICFAIERVMPWASLPVFLTLFFVSLWAAWVIAVKVTEPKSAPARRPV